MQSVKVGPLVLIPWILTLVFIIVVLVLKETQNEPQVNPDPVETERPYLTHLTLISGVGATFGHDLSNWV